MKNQFTLFCLLFVFSISVNAATYYVRTNGNDSNTGLSNTTGSAWKTMAASLKKLKAGDNLLFADGTYNEYDPICNFTGGAKNVRTTIKSINKWGAKIIVDAPNGGISLNSDGIILDGFDISWKANPTAPHSGVQFEGNWMTIRNCNVHDCPFSGIQGSNCDNVLIENNICENNTSTMGTENGSGISIWQPTAVEENIGGYNIIIRNNICRNNWATAPVYDGKPTDGNGIIIDTFKDSQERPGEVFPFKTLVENNLCVKNGGAGITVFESNNVTVRNNTCWYNCYIVQKYFNTSQLNIDGGTGCEFYNNIAVVDPANSNKCAAMKVSDDSGTTKIQNNILCGGWAIFDNGYLTTTEITSGPNTGNITNASSTYPKFVNPIDGAGYDFHLQSTSPIINKGFNENSASVDLDNISRPVGGTVDAGCYEFTVITSNENVLHDSHSSITYTNPMTDNSFKMYFNDISYGATDISIFNLHGDEVYKSSISPHPIVVLSMKTILKSGLYVVRFTNGDKILNGKLVVE